MGGGRGLPWGLLWISDFHVWPNYNKNTSSATGRQPFRNRRISQNNPRGLPIRSLTHGCSVIVITIIYIAYLIKDNTQGNISAFRGNINSAAPEGKTRFHQQGSGMISYSAIASGHHLKLRKRVVN